MVFGLVPLVIHAQCNGHEELCDKRYNEVAYLTTHNAYNAQEEAFNLPNQTYGLTRQLEDGVRGLMLDVYALGGVATVYHSFSFLGTTTLASNLTEIKDFLDANPNEVVTIIFESYINAEMMDSVFTQVGLKPMLHEQTLGEPWPTLQQMIDADRRLVVLSDENDAEVGQEWYHYVWDFAVETDFDNNAQSDFSCDFNRGDSINDLFILNHFITDATIGVGVPAQADVINQFDYFYDRALGCKEATAKFPNFLTVDFYEKGNVFEVADSINGITNSLGVRDADAARYVSVWPNPSSGTFALKLDVGHFDSVSVYNTNGAEVWTKNERANRALIDLSELPDGVYSVVAQTSLGSSVHKLVKLQYAGY